MIINAGTYLLNDSFPVMIATNVSLLGQHNLNFSSNGTDFIGIDFNGENMSVYYTDSDNDHYLAGKINNDLTITIDNRYRAIEILYNQEDTYGALYYLLQYHSTIISNCKNDRNYIVSGETLLNSYSVLGKYATQEGGLAPSKIKDLPDTIEKVCKQQKEDALKPFLYNYDYWDFISPYAICNVYVPNVSSWPLMITIENLSERDVEVLVKVEEYLQNRVCNQETLRISIDAGMTVTQDSSLAGSQDSFGVATLIGVRYV